MVRVRIDEIFVQTRNNLDVRKYMKMFSLLQAQQNVEPPLRLVLYYLLSKSLGAQIQKYGIQNANGESIARWHTGKVYSKCIEHLLSSVDTSRRTFERHPQNKSAKHWKHHTLTFRSAIRIVK